MCVSDFLLKGNHGNNELRFDLKFVGIYLCHLSSVMTLLFIQNSKEFISIARNGILITGIQSFGSFKFLFVFRIFEL